MPGDFDPTTGDMGSTSPPDESSFGGAGAAGKLIGANSLQGSIDQFARAVATLQQSVEKLQGTGLDRGQAGNFNTFPNVQNGQHTNGPLLGQSASNNSGQSTSPGATYSQLGGTGGAYTSQPAPMTKSAASAPQASPESDDEQSQPSALVKGMKTAGGILGSAVAGATVLGLKSMSGQIALNSLQFQNALGGVSFAQTVYSSYGTLGQGSGGTNLFFGGNSPEDSAGRAAVLGQAAGIPFGSPQFNPSVQSTQLGAGVFAAANQFGYNTPGSATQAAQTASQFYSPQFSYNMMAMGYSQTPRVMGQGSGARQPADVFQGMMQRQMGTQQTSAPNFFTNYMSPYGMGNIDVSSLTGGNQQLTQSITTSMGEDNLLRQSGYKGSNNSMQQLFTNAMQPAGKGKSTQKMDQATNELSKYGIPKDLIQTMRSGNAYNTAMEGDTSKGYTEGMRAATTALNKFKAALMGFIDRSHLAGVVGAAEGAASTLAGPIGGALGVHSLLGRIFKTGKKWGKGKGKGSDDDAGDAGDAGAGDAGADAADVGGDVALGAGGLGAAAFGGTLLGGLAIVSQLQPGKGKEGPADVGGRYDTTPGAKPGQGTFGTNTKGGGAVGGGMVTTNQVGKGTSTRNTNYATVSSQAKAAVAGAEAQLGVPYQYGGEMPGKGFDCAGLTQYAYKWAGVEMPRTAPEQYKYWKNKQRDVNLNDVIEGDLLFAREGNHTAMMITSTKIITADNVGTNVRIRNFNMGEWGHAARPTGTMKGFSKGKQTTGTAKATTSSLVNPDPTGIPGTTGGMSAGIGIGDENAKNTGELAATSAAAGGISAGSGYYGAKTTMASNSSSGSGSGAAKASGGSTTQGELSAAAIAALWKSSGGPAGAAANMARIAMAESGDNPSIVQKGEPPGQTGYGLYQITPTSGITQNGKFGNLLNASNNTKAAISLYKSGGYGAWTSDPVGASLAAEGGDVGGGVTAWVGERGPELVHFNQSGDVLTAAQSQRLAKGTVAQSGSSFQTSSLNPIFSGGMPGSSCGGCVVNFSNGSIQFNNATKGAATGSGSQNSLGHAVPGYNKDGAPNTGMSTRSQIAPTVAALSRQANYDAIRAGAQ